MGGQPAYLPLPTSPGAMEGSQKPGRGKRAWPYLATAVPWALFFLFLGLYLSVKLSHPAPNLEQCRSELRNQTSSAEAALSSLRRRLAATEEKENVARGESDRLRGQLAAAERSLLEANGRWEACQNQTETLQQNLTAQTATQQEMQKCRAVTEELRGQLSGKTQELEDSRKENQRQREECDAQIRKIRDQQNKQAVSANSGGGIFGGPAMTLLPLAVPGCLLLLLF